MEAIRQQLKNPLVVAIVGFVVGLIIGLPVLGWGIWPVKYTGAGPKDLYYEAKVDYLRMAIEAFGQNHLVEKARERYESLGDEAGKALADVQKNPGGLTPEIIQAFSIAATTGAPAAPGTPAAGEPGKEQKTQKPAVAAEEKPPASTGSNIWRIVLPVLCLLSLVVIAIAIMFYLRQPARPKDEPPSTAPSVGSVFQQAQQAARQATYTDYVATGTEPPMAQFMASYKLGDDLFDDSFSIDAPTGEFLGECGVGISDTIGVGEPKKVSAFEVWLFDKNDIQTVTKVLMSNHDYTDETIRQRLAAKGEPVSINPGSETVLETQTLRMVARVVDMGYGEGPLPPDSFFDRFILELAIWQKQA